jgi:hypothetical protein
MHSGRDKGRDWSQRGWARFTSPGQRAVGCGVGSQVSAHTPREPGAHWILAEAGYWSSESGWACWPP